MMLASERTGRMSTPGTEWEMTRMGAIAHDRRSKASGRASVPPSSASEFGGGHLHQERGHGGGHLHHGGGSHHHLNGHHGGSQRMLANSEDLHAWSIYRQVKFLTLLRQPTLNSPKTVHYTKIMGYPCFRGKRIPLHPFMYNF